VNRAISLLSSAARPARTAEDSRAARILGVVGEGKALLARWRDASRRRRAEIRAWREAPPPVARAASNEGGADGADGRERRRMPEAAPREIWLSALERVGFGDPRDSAGLRQRDSPERLSPRVRCDATGPPRRAGARPRSAVPQ